jgi:hypothetical protein
MRNKLMNLLTVSLMQSNKRADYFMVMQAFIIERKRMLCLHKIECYVFYDVFFYNHTGLCKLLLREMMALVSMQTHLSRCRISDL